MCWTENLEGLVYRCWMVATE